MFAELDRLLTEEPHPSRDDSLENALNYVNSRYRPGMPTSSSKRPSHSPSISPSHDGRREATGAIPPNPDAAAAPAATPIQFNPINPSTNLRPTVAASPQPTVATAAPRRFNLWMVLATVVVMVSCFGASFFVVLSMLQNSDR